jgi:putrescine transport system ATP-binding protein
MGSGFRRNDGDGTGERHTQSPYLRIAGIAKRFGLTAAVDDVSLDIARGEFFALLGPSGCGKTTLLRILAGLETPDAGRIVIDGVDMTDVPPYARPVNMMFQSYALFPHMTVAQNVAFGLRQEGMARSAIGERVQAMLDLVQMGELAHRRPHQLSGGQRQRVALARALAKQPKLLLLDEPLAALDRKLREQTQFELMRIQERVGITFIVVTHDQSEAMTMASRIAVMDAGKLRQVGPPRTVYEAPNSRFVADFIGAVNLLAARAVAIAAEGGLVLESEAVGTLVTEPVAGVAVGDAVTVALRPEKIALGLAPPETPHNRAAGTVREVAYLGGLSLYRIELGNGVVLRTTLPNAARLTTPVFARGESVHLSWSPSCAMVLTE